MWGAFLYTAFFARGQHFTPTRATFYFTYQFSFTLTKSPTAMTALLDRKSPLSIPVIRRRISRFVSVSDAVSCVQVSKDWSEEFAFPIRFSIDFKTQFAFQQLSTVVTAKHGHLICKIENLSTQEQLDDLLHPNISNLHTLDITCATNARFRVPCMDLISKNSKRLKVLCLDVDNNARDLSARVISLSAVTPAPQLTSIRLLGVCISRASFSALLRGCPLLVSVDLQCNVALLSGPSINPFQHPRVVELVVHVEMVFKPDPHSAVSDLGYTLLVHFPNLIKLCLFPLETTLIVPVERIIAEARLCCTKERKLDT